jgi:hypothetical protein
VFDFALTSNLTLRVRLILESRFFHGGEVIERFLEWLNSCQLDVVCKSYRRMKFGIPWMILDDSGILPMIQETSSVDIFASLRVYKVCLTILE